MNRIIDEKSLLKKKAVDSKGNPISAFKYKRKEAPSTPDDQQAKALQRIAEIIEQGLSQKTDYDKLILSVSNAIIEMIKQTNNEMENILRELANNFKFEDPVPNPITEIDVYKISRDHRGMMTGFKMKAKR